MNPLHLAKITAELSLKSAQVQATAQLLEEGGTVPFIARYRKEATGTLDEVQITAIRDRLAQLDELDKRRDAILKSLEERKLLTPELNTAVTTAETLPALEDIYLPYRPKKRTRAMIAKEKGLEPLADLLFAQDPLLDPETAAAPYIRPGAGDLSVETIHDALAGARDIIAEKINDDAEARALVRTLFMKKGLITSKVLEDKKADPAAAKYKDYFEWSEPLATAPSHRVLAIRRGAAEGVLLFRVTPPEEEALYQLESLFLTGRGPASDHVKLAIKDSFKRLLGLSLETEARLESKKKADAAAITVFTQNLRELLLAPPLGQKNVLAIDPGFRTGCKTVVLDRQGKLLHNDVIYPDQGAHKTAEAEHTVKHLVQKHHIEAIAIGNGTGSRETESFIKKLELQTSNHELPSPIPIIMVNESGASIYSASDVAREEFPDHDLTVRGAVSIGRRLMDPLAELVKLDPKSIGVGQYQHDVDQDALKNALDDTVISCVNAVGVEVNTASKQLLTYVSGLNAAIAENIVNHRNQHGPFTSRAALKDVPRLGPKTFEQAAGFLRIRDAAGGGGGGGVSKNPLDASAVHPESYPLVDRMAKDLHCTIQDLIAKPELRKSLDLQKYVSPNDGIGLPTLTDILAELAKPGRDPRQQFEAFHFTDGVNKIEDVHPGMKLNGIVTNVTAFGAFIDIGVHQDGLAHVSQLADRFVKDPADVVKVSQRVEVTVLEVDLPRKRISLTLRKSPQQPPLKSPDTKKTTPAQSTPKPAPTPGWFTQALQNAKQNP